MTKKEIKILQDIEAEHFLLLQEVSSILGSENESSKLWRARWGAYHNILEKLGIESDMGNANNQRAIEIMTKNRNHESI